MQSLKNTQTSEYNKKRSTLTDTENQLVLTSWGRGAGRIWMGLWEAQSTEGKIGYKNVLYNTRNIASTL